MVRPQLWMRSEVRETERRAPIVPTDARRLVDSGIGVTVEHSDQRVFPISEFADAGCDIAAAGSWTAAPADTYVIGLKELPATPEALVHRHIFFGHAYKKQDGAEELLRRFAAGGGELLDIEYLVDGTGRRLAAFGYWAGYIGAALAILHSRGQLSLPLQPKTKQALDAELASFTDGDQPRALVIGALGRSGRGAIDGFAAAGISATGWDVAETRHLDRTALLAHDILVNTVLTRQPVPPFLTSADLDEPDRRLSVVSDVTVDVTSDLNVLPIYSRTTTWDQPAERLRAGTRPLDLIAIDNLPSLLPREASLAFSEELTPQLQALDAEDSPWATSANVFTDALELLRSA